MTYSNTWKRANGATISIDGTVHENATIIGIPGEQIELIEKTTLGATRREWAPSDMPDSPEIVVTLPLGADTPDVGDEGVAVIITLPKLSKTYTFDATVVSVLPAAAEVDGLLGVDVTLKPTTEATVA